MLELKAQNRTVFGKKVKSLRREGLIPTELFGHGIKNLHLSVPTKDFAKIYKEAGENTIINIVTEDNKKIPALISTVERDSITEKFLAIDFYGVRMDEKIKIKVPVEFTGTAPAIKAGYLIIKVTDEIEIEALPAQIPHRFEVDLSPLENLGQSIHVSNLETPEGVKILTPADLVVATVTEKAKEEVAPPPPPAAEVGAEATTTAAPTAQPTEEKTKEEPSKS